MDNGKFIYMINREVEKYPEIHIGLVKDPYDKPHLPETK